MTTIKLKNGSGAPTAGDLVVAEPALDLTNKRLYTEDSGGTVIEVGTNPTSVTTGDITATGTATFAGLTTTADVSFGDNDKAIFGAGSDLQIYHDGTNSHIVDAGSGILAIAGNSAVGIYSQGTSENMIIARSNAEVELYYDNSQKLETTSTGIDVTGTVTADGLTVDGTSDLNGTVTVGTTYTTEITGNNVDFKRNDGASYVRQRGGHPLVFQTFETTDKNRINIAANGDISFYEDTGTTAKLFWDASAESLGIGTSNADGTLHVHSGSAGTITAAASANNLVVENNGAVGLSLLFDDAANNAYGNIYWGNETDGNADGRITYFGSTYVTAADRQSMEFRTAGAARMRIDSSGNVGIGCTPSAHAFSKAIQIGDGAVWTVGGNQNSTFASNAYLASNGQYKYIAANKASKINLYNGGFTVSTTNTSGSADDDITFTDRLTVDASGNVGIGCTPSRNLDIQGTGDTLVSIVSPAANQAALFFGDTDSDSVGRVAYDNSDNSMRLNTNGSERMRIDSSGNVGIGVSDPDVKLEVNGSARFAQENHSWTFDDTINSRIGFVKKSGNYPVIASASGIPLIFSTSDNSNLSSSVASQTLTERMRLDSSGNLLVGTTTTPTSSAKNIVLANGTAPTASATDGVILYAEDVSSSSELKVRDEAGNITTLSPHNFDLIPQGPSEDMAWSYYSERDGKQINVDMLKAIRVLEKLSGEQLVFEN